ncbi:MAG: LytR C-terminal domain-containing protein [Candidatus Saccharimonadales bacterium]
MNKTKIRGKKSSKPLKIEDIRPAKEPNVKTYITFKIRKKYLLFLPAIAILIIVVIGIINYHNTHKFDNQKSLNQVVSLVGRHIVLPTGETPTLATITGHDKLDHSSILYSKGKDGDRVLIYVQAGLVYIYRPSIDRIVAVGPVSVDQGIPESKNASITIEDSTNRPTIAQQVKDKVQTAYPYSKVSIGSGTNKPNFPSTLIIDNTNNKDNLVNDLTSLLNAKRGVVPLSEDKLSSDMEIIIGTDYQGQ